MASTECLNVSAPVYIPRMRKYAGWDLPSLEFGFL